jgi:hypothetical protein
LFEQPVSNHTTAAAFVWRMIDDLREQPEARESDTLSTFLSAVALVLGELDEVAALEAGERDQPTWETFVRVLWAARSRE